MIPGAPKVESGDFRTATTEEAARLGRSALAYAGPFHVKEDAEKPGKVILSHSMTVCTFPNWLGNTQVRNSNLEGNVLELSPLNLIPTLVSKGLVELPSGLVEEELMCDFRAKIFSLFYDGSKPLSIRNNADDQPDCDNTDRRLELYYLYYEIINYSARIYIKSTSRIYVFTFG